MSIVSSDVTIENPQVDGRFWVREKHVDNLGVQHVVDYLASQDLDYTAVMEERAVSLADQLVMDEVRANIDMIKRLGAQANPTFDYSTKSDQAGALRRAYQNMTQTEAIFTGEYLAGFTNAQLAGAFELTLPQVTTLRANKLTPAVNLAASIRASVGG